ncbi:Parapinopsin [Trichoplax sp. H2]|nr:Parapinopsin [Trichoplax sp. H2]|eukprot:RDD38029.1 Parapinopsin [Trichoplax sp. H2]
MNSLNVTNTSTNNTINRLSTSAELLARLGAITLVIIGAGIILNIILIIGTHFKKSLRKKTYYFMANLAGCDLLFSLSIISTVITAINTSRAPIPSHIHTILCKVCIVFPAYWSYTASVQTLVIISLERYRAIFRPTKKITPKKCKMLCALAWIISLFISLPFLFTARSIENQCLPFPIYSHWVIIVNFILIIFQFVIPTIVMITAYTLILHQLTTKTTAIGQESTNSRNLKRKTVYMLLVTTITFLLCALPWTLTLLFEATTGKFAPELLLHDNKTNPAMKMIVTFSRITLSISTVYNPIIYCIFNREIRSLFFPCYYRRKNNAVTTTKVSFAPEKSNSYQTISVKPVINPMKA